MNNLPLEIELSSERLRRHLQENPHDATRLAIAHFEDFAILAIEFKKLEMENSKLRSAKTHQSVTLPALRNLNRGAS